MFESSVVLDGTKTSITEHQFCAAFESSVVLDGTKTTSLSIRQCRSFESSVVLDGTKTLSLWMHLSTKTGHRNESFRLVKS